MPKRDNVGRRVTSRDVPTLLQELSCGDPNAQAETLHALCPCRNRRYDKEVWRAIFAAQAESDNAQVRDAATHAIETLRERARTDPRSQELLLWLVEQDVPTRVPLDLDVPAWIPNLRGNGLYIPRYEPAPRSKANRRRR